MTDDVTTPQVRGADRQYSNSRHQSATHYFFLDRST